MQSAFRDHQKKKEKEGGKKELRTDPFADLSVDEDQVVQRQNYFCCSTSPSSEAEPYPAVSPGQSGKRKQVSRFGARFILTRALLDLLEGEEEISSKSSQCDEQK